MADNYIQRLADWLRDEIGETFDVEWLNRTYVEMAKRAPKPVHVGIPRALPTVGHWEYAVFQPTANPNRTRDNQFSAWMLEKESVERCLSMAVANVDRDALGMYIARRWVSNREQITDPVVDQTYGPGFD